MAMPAAKGLFHRAIIESSPGLRGQEAAVATDYAERLMAKLGIKPGQVDKLQKLPAERLLDASELPAPPAGVIGAGKSMPLTPVVDGQFLPAHPFDPIAAPTASEIPLIIGTNRDEAALFLAGDPQSLQFTESELLQRLTPMLGERLKPMLEVYKKSRPAATPWDLYIALSSEDRRLGCIQLAERKIAGGTAPVYMYLFTWQTDYQDYIYKSCHTLEIPFAFGNVTDVTLTGSRSDKYKLASSVCGAWSAFARCGNPSHPGIPEWEKYKLERRSTMVFDVPCRLEVDPYREELDAWNGLEIIP
jgi:para-nitrobenzyl esterase